uniref:STAS domain-containing protein n=1 Tax=Parastrongyloides trichosuri TaxID=131310 RepID=A0A0N4ZR27_PARTI
MKEVSSPKAKSPVPPTPAVPTPSPEPKKDSYMWHKSLDNQTLSLSLRGDKLDFDIDEYSKNKGNNNIKAVHVTTKKDKDNVKAFDDKLLITAREKKDSKNKPEEATISEEELVFPSWIKHARVENLRDNNPIYNFASVARRIEQEKKKAEKKDTDNKHKQVKKIENAIPKIRMKTARGLSDFTPKKESLTKAKKKVVLPNKNQKAGKTLSNIIQHPFEKPNDVFTQEEFDKVNGFRRTNLSKVSAIVNYWISFTKWKKSNWIHFFVNRMPIVHWLPRYNLKAYLLMDIVAGIVMAVMSIPQGLAYGMLVGLPPIHGLYTSVIGPFIYVFFGSSKHVSPGAFSIIALMVGNFVEQSRTNHGPFLSEEEEKQFKILTAAGLTFFTGIIQMILGIVNAGLFAVYLSDPLIKGLTTGAAIHVLISQIKGMTGVEIAVKSSESFGFFAYWIYFFGNIKTISWQACLISFVGGGLLIFSKEIIDTKLVKSGIKFKFPMEMIVVVLSTLLLYLLCDVFHVSSSVKYVGKVDHGMRAPQMLDFSQWTDMLKAAFFIAIVCFVIHFALAKTVAKMDNQQINVNQEWLALGLMNTISSFFGCFASGASMSRTITQYKLGAKSQLSTLTSVLIILGVIYGGSKYLYYLPKPILSVIVVVALKDLLFQITIGRVYWRHSIIDFIIWLVTLLAVLLVDVESGLCAGIIFALLTVVFRSQWAESCTLGRIPGTSIYKGLHHYRFAEEVSGIKVFRYDAPLYYANSECFLHNLYEAVGIDPIGAFQKVKETVAEKSSQIDLKQKNGNDVEANAPLIGDKNEEMRIALSKEGEKDINKNERDNNRVSDVPQKEKSEICEIVVTHLVIDCSAFPYIDIMGKDVLIQAYNEFKVVGIKVFYAGAKVSVRQCFERTDFYDYVPKHNIYVSIADAVAQAQNERRIPVNKRKIE